MLSLSINPGGPGDGVADLVLSGQGLTIDTDGVTINSYVIQSTEGIVTAAAPEIHGTKWEDLNGDGVWDAGESGMADVTIYADLDQNGQLDAGEPSTVTDGNGDYVLAGLEPGEYTVAEVTPVGWQQTYPDPRYIERVSVAYDGAEGNGPSNNRSSISTNGRFVAFGSGSSNLVPADTNAKADVFAYDRETETIERVSLAHDGAEGNLSSSTPSISGDGRYVAFLSNASNLVPGDTNDVQDVFVYDRQTDTIERVSLADDGTQGEQRSQGPSISADGRYVVFQSLASNLVSGDTNDQWDIFVYDRQTDTIKCVSLGDDGLPGNTSSTSPSISADGRYVAFSSRATNLVPGDNNGKLHNFVYNRDTETIERVSLTDGGSQGNNDSYSPSISADGRHVAFSSNASNLVPGDTNGQRDIFVRDRQTGTIQRVSMAYDGSQSDGLSPNCAISGDGRYVAFESRATNLVPDDTNNASDIFVYDRQTDTIQLANLGHDGSQGNDRTLSPTISADGRYVAFLSWANNLVPGDSNGQRDVFISAVVDAAVPGTHAVTLTAGQIETGVQFGNQLMPAEIHGAKWEDLNADGLQDAGEPSLEGWTIFLDDNGDGILDAGEQSTLTSPNGNYSFADLAEGTYTVAEVAQPDWLQTYPGGDGSHPLSLAQGQIVRGITFGNSSGSILGTKFNDLNSNGVRDADEPGLEGWTIYLDLDNDGVLDAEEPRDVTDEFGQYAIRRLAPDTYTVAEVIQTDWEQSFPGGAGSQQVTVALGEVVPNVDFGNHIDTGILGTKWDDFNGDGVRDAGEPGLAGVTVYLDSDNNGQLDPGERSTVTAADGQYSFMELPAGTYIVAEEVPDPYQQTFPLVWTEGTGELSFTQMVKDGTEGADWLDEARAVVLSPDGKFAYVAAFRDDALSVFRRDATTGELTFVQAEPGLYGLDGVRSVAVSPDGSHLYAAAQNDDALTVFDRDATTGELTHVQWLEGLDGASFVTLSPDGNHVYATGRDDDSLVVFDRDATTGELTLLEMFKDGLNGVDGLDGVESVTVSPDGNFVYTAAYNDGAVTLFERDAATGRLTFVEVLKDGVNGVDGLNGASYLAISPDGNSAYAVAYVENSLVAFDRDAATGKLTTVQIFRNGVGINGLNTAAWVSISADGRHLYTAADINDAVMLFDRDTTSGELTFVQMAKNNQNGVTGLNGARAVALSTDGRHLYVAADTDDAVAVFELDHDRIVPAHSLTLEPGQIVTGADFGNRNRELSIIHGAKWEDLDGNRVWGSGEPAMAGVTIYLDLNDNGQLDGGEPSTTTNQDGEYSFTQIQAGDYTVAEVVPPDYRQTYPFVWAGGELSFLQVLKDGQDGVDGLAGANSVAVSPDGAHVYAAGRDDHALAVFSQVAGTGELTFVQTLRDGQGGVDGLGGVSCVTVSPDGDHVYATGESDDALAVFERNTVTGELSFVQVLKDGQGQVDGLDGASSVILSLDGAHLYATGRDDNALAVFSRDAGTGELAFVQVLRDGQDGIYALEQANSVAVSPDGRHVYATGHHGGSFYDYSLLAFERDAATGELSFVEALTGERWQEGPISVIVSPDGSHVYTVSDNGGGEQDGVLAVLERNRATGRLSFVNAYMHIDGEYLLVASSVAVSPDGSHVFATTRQRLWALTRNPVTGELDFMQALRDGQGGVDGLDGAYSVAVSPDGTHVYAVGRHDNALAVFERAGNIAPRPHHLTLQPGEVATDIDFGNQALSPGIHGTKWYDLNADGVRDAGEPGLAGWTIYVDLDDDGQLDAGEPFVLTDEDGDYSLAELPPGTYVVAEVIEGGWNQTYPDGDGRHTVTLAADQVVTDIDFGNFLPPGEIHGTKWSDLDADGVWDAGEPGSAGWTVYLDLDNNGQLDWREPRALTDANGEYSLTELIPGTYTVAEQMQDGWEQRHPGGDGRHTVVLASGEVATDIDFGNHVPPAEIHGTKWEDLDGNGVRDAGEQGLTNVTIYLDLNDNGQLDAGEPQTLTDDNGQYSFVDLSPDTYFVAEVVPIGFMRTYPPPGQETHVVVLHAGDVAAGIDFGNYVPPIPPGEIHGTKWDDLDGDRVRDAGEPGVQDVTIYLDQNNNGQHDAWELAALTGPGGQYSFTNLLPDTYRVAEIVSPGMEQTFPPPGQDVHVVTVEPDEVVTDIDFGNVVLGEIHGTKWEDLDGDATRDAGEPGLVDVTIYLDLDDNGQLDAGEPETVTNGSGLYSFTDLLPDTYVVAEIVPGGMVQTYPPSPQDTHTVILESGDVASGVDFGNTVPPGEIHGTKWHDVNDNGVWDGGEPAVEGWTIYLDLDGSGELDPGEPSTPTDENGEFAFMELAPATYTVAEIHQLAWEQTFPGGDGRHTVTLAADQVVTDINFGNTAASGEIHGTKWHDLNGDGVHDAGEPGLADWTVYLDLDEDGQPGAGEPLTVTDENGQYSLTGIRSGIYRVVEVMQADWEQTHPGGDGWHTVTLAKGEVVTGIDFRNVSTSGRIEGAKWHDLDEDGIWDAGEPGVVDVTIYLDLDDNGQLDGGEPSIVTNQDGDYSFANLLPNTYTVREVLPDGYAQTFPGAGGAAHVLVLQSGDVLTGINFGNRPLPVGIHGTKWEDSDGDGLHDSGEPGLAGVTVYLDLDDNGRLDTGEPSTVTDGDGAYSLTDLEADTYTVAEVVPDGYQQTFPDEPGQHSVTLQPGQDATGIDFGNYPLPVPVTIADVSLAEGDTGTTVFEFTVTLAESSVQTVSVDYSTADDTATGVDNDYVAVSDTLTFEPGQTSKTITVPVNGDMAIETDETFFINLSNATYATIDDAQAVGTILNDDWVIDIALVPVLTPSPSSLPGAPLPTPVDNVAAGVTYYVEVWAQDTGVESSPVGVTGGSVDVHYTTALADAVAVHNLDFDLLAGGTIDEPGGLVDDLGGGTFLGSVGVAPDWARLAYVELVARGHGEVTFELTPGVFQFSRFGPGNVDWDHVGLPEPVTVNQVAGARVDMTLVRQPTPFDEPDTGEVDALPASESWIHGWEPFWVEIWTSTPDTTEFEITGGTIDLPYDTALTTAVEIEYGPAFSTNRSGTIDDLAGKVDDLGGQTARTDVGDDRFALLGRVRFEPTADDTVSVDESAHFIGPYDLALGWADVHIEVAGSPAGSELGETPATDLYGMVYDIDENDLIDFGDFSFFAGAFGQVTGGGEPPYTWWADFDKSNLVDFGDLGTLAPNFARSKPDDTVNLPPGFPDAWITGRSPAAAEAATLTGFSAELKTARVDVELVAVSRPTASDQSATVPESLQDVSMGSTYYVEVWVQDVGSPGVGITGGLVDVGYTTSAADVTALSHGTVFTFSPLGTIDDPAGLVDDFGGGTLTGNIGVAPAWARLGYVECAAISAEPISFTLAPGRLEFSRFNAGNVSWDDVTLGQLTLNERLGAEVVGRHVFYNNSVFDGNNADPNSDDDSAIAPDPASVDDPRLGKTALLPGGTAAFQNYTSYARGINGIMVDMAGLAGTPVAGDFELKVGNDNDPSDWGDAPVPTSVTVRWGGGDGGSDRVTLIWDDHDPSHPETTAVAKGWLQVTVLATENTGLAEPDVFYYGNAIGESGTSTTDAKVNAIDMLAARNNPHNFFNPAPLDDFVDFDRDQKVNATDMLIARNNTTNFFTALKLIAVPPAAGDAVPGGKGRESRVESREPRVEGEELRSVRSRLSTLDSGLSAHSLDWLVEFEQPDARRRGAGKGGTVEMAVDRLLGMDSP